MWQEGKSGNPSGRPKKEDTFKAYCDKWSKRSKKVVKVDDKQYKINSKEYSVIAIFKMIQDDNTPPQVKLQAIKLMLEYTEGKPTPEFVNNVTVQNMQEVSKNYLDDIKTSLDKLTPQERDTYFELCDKLNNEND